MLLYSASNLAIQVVLLSRLEGDFLTIATFLLFLAPLSNGLILALLGEPASLYRARGPSYTIRVSIAALFISLAVGLSALFVADSCIGQPALLALLLTIVLQQTTGPARRISYGSSGTSPFQSASAFIIILSLACLFKLLSVTLYMTLIASASLVSLAVFTFFERRSRENISRGIVEAAIKYGVPLTPSVILAWIPIGVSGLALTHSSPEMGTYFKGALNFIVPAQVLISANQARLLSQGATDTSASALKILYPYSVLIGVFSAILVAGSPLAYEIAYGSPPHPTIRLITAIFALSMVFQFLTSIHGVQIRISGKTSVISKGYFVGAAFSAPSIILSYLYSSPILAALAVLASGISTYIYLRRVDDRS
ncbi:MAG: hypothetical protein ACJ8GV_07650 [Luteimonas sp.]